MNTKTIQHMQYFVGKVCSIVTSSMNRSFDEKTAREHFAIRVEDVNSDGIWGTHPYNEEMVSFFSMLHVISIHEEVELNPENPEHAEMLKEYEAKTGKPIKSDIKQKFTSKSEPKAKNELLPVLNNEASPLVSSEDVSGDATFVDIESLERLAEDTRRAYTSYDAHDLRIK